MKVIHCSKSLDNDKQHYQMSEIFNLNNEISNLLIEGHLKKVNRFYMKNNQNIIMNRKIFFKMNTMYV